MQQAGLPELSIQFFHHYYDQLVAGATGFIDSATAGPVTALPNYDDLSAVHVKAGEAALARTIVLKLNGGLGTSMGMDGPKALLPVKDGLTFLDIIVRQILHLRRTTGVRLPLVLMNSFVTHKATMSALEQYDALTQDLPLAFVQSENPKIWAETLAASHLARRPQQRVVSAGSWRHLCLPCDKWHVIHAFAKRL